MDMPPGTIGTILKDSIMVYGNWIEIWLVLFLLCLNDCDAVMLCLCSTVHTCVHGIRYLMQREISILLHWYHCRQCRQ
jgi:hypothetical protein